MRALPLCLLLIALLGFAGSASAEDAPVEAELQWEPGRVGPFSPMYPPFRVALPKDLEPIDDLKDARYSRIRWGDGPGLALAVDVASGSERLLVDTDLDGDLRDETSSHWYAQSVSGWRTETIRVAYVGEDAVQAEVRFYHQPGAAVDRVRITPFFHRRGYAVLGGRLRLVALVDDNADMRFDNPKRDRLYVDVDGDGRFNTTAGGHEAVTLGKPFRVGDAGFVASVPHPSGRIVLFEPSADVPPRVKRAWPRTGVPQAGRKQNPPAESFDALKKRIDAERGKPYADRYKTIQQVGFVGTEPARQLLLDLVKNESDVNVRSAATRAMGNAAYLEKGAKDVVGIATSGSTPPAVASAAAQALHDMGYEDREKVYLDMITSSDATILGAAARYLGYLGTEKAVQAVLTAWRDRQEDNARYQIYQGLRALKDGPPRDLVIEAARSSHTSLAAQALRDLHATDHPEARALALEAAARRPLVEYLGKAVAAVLGAYGDAEAVKALLELASAATPALELEIAKALRPIREPASIDALIRGLKRKFPGTRDLAARTLAGIPTPEATAALLARAKREKDDTVLASILEALGDHGDEQSVDVLLKHARKRNDTVRQAAVRALGRVGFEHPRVRKFLVGLLQAKDWEDRVLAIDAAAAAGDPKLCRQILPSLDHEKRPVRLAAAQAIETLRCAQAIERLIRRLEREDEVRIVDAIASALYRITGMNLYDDAEIWRTWWKEHGKGFRVPDEVGELPPQDAGGTRAGFYGIPIRSGRVIFVIDQSGSMSAEDQRETTTGAPSGNRLDVAVREVIAGVDGMGKRDFVNVILFHSTIHPWSDELRRLSSKNRDDLRKHLLSKQPTGGTNLYDGLEVALLDPDVDTIFLLSDGVPGSGKFVAKADILRAVKRLNQTKRVAIHGVSIGRDSDLLRDLAKENGGKYVRR